MLSALFNFHYIQGLKWKEQVKQEEFANWVKAVLALKKTNECAGIYINAIFEEYFKGTLKSQQGNQPQLSKFDASEIGHEREGSFFDYVVYDCTSKAVKFKGKKRCFIVCDRSTNFIDDETYRPDIPMARRILSIR